MTASKSQILDRTFSNTARALAEYDSTAAARQLLWDKIDTMEDVHAVEAADQEALVKAQQAFWEDTKDINSRRNCGLVDVSFMRRMVTWFNEQREKQALESPELSDA